MTERLDPKNETLAQIVVLPVRADRKPFELCVAIYEGETRLDHEDYPITREELLKLRDRISTICG